MRSNSILYCFREKIKSTKKLYTILFISHKSKQLKYHTCKKGIQQYYLWNYSMVWAYLIRINEIGGTQVNSEQITFARPQQ